MVDPDPVEAIGFGECSGFGGGVYDGAIDHEINLFGTNANFQSVERCAIVPWFLHGIVGGFGSDVAGGVAIAAFDQPHAILGDDEVHIVLLRSIKVAAAEHKAVVVGMAARLHQLEAGFQGVGSGGVVGRVVVDGSFWVGGVEAGSHGDEFDVARAIGVGGGGATVNANFPVFWGLLSGERG